MEAMARVGFHGEHFTLGFCSVSSVSCGCGFSLCKKEVAVAAEEEEEAKFRRQLLTVSHCVCGYLDRGISLQ
ncbi:hypothetical protein RJT34_20495 [Clitoria ternatea]|uniref:Uncharacterized protein n=1 Tax=Clitoria ternatea TaxID=43366 RepID=A0AAN9ITB6_CLITE